jgi:hypothetical protein
MEERKGGRGERGLEVKKKERGKVGGKEEE